MKTQDRYNLTTGSILHKLITLALPIMGSNVVQMAYNLTDMFWLGRLGSGAVAASGTVGIYLWLVQAPQYYGNKGAEIGVSQNMGRGNPAAARSYAQEAFTLSAILGVIFGVLMFIFRDPLIGFYNIQEPEVVADAITYMQIVALGVPFTYLTATIHGCFSGSGNSLTPFYLNAIALVLNMVLDPLLIFGAGLGIAGAAIATVLAQILACVLMVIALRRYRHPAFEQFKLLVKPNFDRIKHIARWTNPIVIESFFFTFLSMLLSRIVAGFGAGSIAAQRIGTQIESIGWLISGGFASAFTAYVGQNYGAGAWRRIHRGFRLSTVAMCVWGLVASAALFFGAEALFTIFLPNEPEVVAQGAALLRILAIGQVPQCLEPIAAGAFRGMGRSTIPSVVSISVNVIRVGAAWVWSQQIGVDGVWWAIGLGTFARGVVGYICYMVASRKLPKHDTPPPGALETEPATLVEAAEYRGCENL